MAKYLSIKVYCSLFVVFLIIIASTVYKDHIPYYTTFSNGKLSRSDAKQLLQRYEHFAKISDSGCQQKIIEVNGISEGEGDKQVKFTWTLSGPSEEAVLRCYGTGAVAGEPHKAVAIIQLYDNGWQVEFINQK